MIAVDGRPTRLSASLLDAYRRTRYVVSSDPQCVLAIGCHSPTLAALHRDFGVQGSVFLTAANPGSQPLSAAENRTRLHALRQDLIARELRYIEGYGEAVDGSWDAEASVWVPGLEQTHAVSIARRFDQNAIVVCTQDAVPQLLCMV